MTGRLTQLGRQLRKLRHILGGPASLSPLTTLRRATQLASDLAREHAAVEDAQAAFHDLGVRGIVDPALVERLALAAAQRDDVVAERAMSIGRDLDTFLRSLEVGAPAPELAFDAIVPLETVAAKPESTAGVPISGRVVELAVSGGAAVITVDAQPIEMTQTADTLVTSFALTAAPTSTPEIQRERTGVTRVVWGPENLSIELAPDFRRARVETPNH